MTVFGAISEVYSSTGKLWDLLRPFDFKGTVDLKKYNFN